MKKNKSKVLFVCIHNSARSQMAEAYLSFFGNKFFDAESAGLEPGTLNPLVVEVMKEEGIDISENTTNSVFDYLKQGRRYDFVITVCDETSGERCPVFPGQSQRLHWGFEDPSGLGGTQEERLEQTRNIRDQIKKQVQNFVQNFKNSSSIFL